jgi:hypothetical protein
LIGSRIEAPPQCAFARSRDVPITATLADAYTVCDRWLASLPADTQANRLMALCGGTRLDTSGAIKLPFRFLPTQHTRFDWLASRNERFEIYVDSEAIPAVGMPSNLLLMRSEWRHVRRHAFPLSRLAMSGRVGAGPPM